MEYSSGLGNLTAITSPFISDTNFGLRSGSAAINAGSNDGYASVNGPATDLAGRLRILGGTIDMGAYELPPDLTPRLYALPSSIYGTTAFSVRVELMELNAVSTTGLLTLRINKDPRQELSLDQSLTTLNGHAVQNSQWRLDSTHPAYYILTSSAEVVGGDVLSVGLTGSLVPGSTSGVLSVSGVVVSSGGEFSLLNNTDADKVDYFQQ